MTTPRLSVIIVTWNVRELVLACLAALERELRDVAHEVIVVDNASSDDTVSAIRRECPHVMVIANSSNVGFPIANNQALARAGGEYVLFLNPDTEVGPGAVQACMQEIAADPAAGMCGCRLVLENGQTQYESARRAYRLRHMVLELFYLHMLFPRNRICGDQVLGHWDHLGVRDVEAICGAFMLARTEAVRAVGGLPDEIFMYHEDLALCLRLRAAGWRIRYRGDVTTLHRWRGSSRKSSAPLALLEGMCKVSLIREGQGAIAGALARVLFAVRCVLRVVIATTGQLLPRAWHERYPRVFDVRMHALQLMWAVAPFAVSHLVPGVSRETRAALTAAA